MSDVDLSELESKAMALESPIAMSVVSICSELRQLRHQADEYYANIHRIQGAIVALESTRDMSRHAKEAIQTILGERYEPNAI